MSNCFTTGGWYGAAGGVLNSNGTKEITNVSYINEEIDDLLFYLNYATSCIDSASGTIIFPGGDQVYTDTSVAYGLVTSALDGSITFSSTNPTATFYLFIGSPTDTSPIDLTQLTIKAGGNVQPYNIYLISNFSVTLGGDYEGNFIVSSITGAATITGSANCILGSISTVPLTVYWGVPRYVSTYAAIGYTLLDMQITGGVFGVTAVSPTNVYGNSTEITNQSNNLDELQNVVNFRTEFNTFITFHTQVYNNDYVLQVDTVNTTSKTVFPVEDGFYYQINKNNDVITVTFAKTGPEYHYYFYNDSSDIDLNRITFSNMENMITSNIYFITSSNNNYSIYLSSNKTYYGTFISGYGLETNPSPSGSAYATVYGSVYGTYTNNSNGYPAFLNVNFATVCFMEGSKILTDQWYVPVEELKEGDTVMTFGELVDNQCVSDNVPMKILRMQKHVRKASLKTSPIVFTKNVFGVNCPFENLYVSPNHGMIDRKGRRFPAKKFVNHVSIFQDPTVDTITYYHIELAKHCTVMANGVLTETYNDPRSEQLAKTG